MKKPSPPPRINWRAIDEDFKRRYDEHGPSGYDSEMTASERHRIHRLPT